MFFCAPCSQLQSKTLLALPRQLSKSCMLLSSQALYRMGILPQADGVSVRDRQAFAPPKGDVEQRSFFEDTSMLKDSSFVSANEI